MSGSIRASRLLSSRRRAPGPRLLPLFPGAGVAGVLGVPALGDPGVGEEGTRMPGPRS